MKQRLKCAVMLVLICATCAWAGDAIPKAAWKRAIGLPLENAGSVKPQLKGGMIDDGYWQGAPVGGFGAGTFSRTYRGDFSRWHIKGGVHKYQTVWANQFAMYQKSEGGRRHSAGSDGHASDKRNRSFQLEVGLSRRRRRLLLALSQILVRLQMGKIPRARDAGTVLSRPPRQL